MFAAPAEGILKDFMEFAETGCADHEQAPPHQRTHATEHYAKLINRNRRYGRFRHASSLPKPTHTSSNLTPRTAILTFIVTRNLTATIAVIIVAGACGVAAGTPLAILAGIGSVARRGIIVKGGLYLEKLANIDTIVLDKTGTLTIGAPEVTGIQVGDRPHCRKAVAA